MNTSVNQISDKNKTGQEMWSLQNVKLKILLFWCIKVCLGCSPKMNCLWRTITRWFYVRYPIWIVGGFKPFESFFSYIVITYELLPRGLVFVPHWLVYVWGYDILINIKLITQISYKLACYLSFSWRSKYLCISFFQQYSCILKFLIYILFTVFIQ
jgi:hypothetical protein